MDSLCYSSNDMMARILITYYNNIHMTNRVRDGSRENEKWKRGYHSNGHSPSHYESGRFNLHVCIQIIKVPKMQNIRLNSCIS